MGLTADFTETWRRWRTAKTDGSKRWRYGEDRPTRGEIALFAAGVTGSVVLAALGQWLPLLALPAAWIGVYAYLLGGLLWRRRGALRSIRLGHALALVPIFLDALLFAPLRVARDSVRSWRRADLSAVRDHRDEAASAPEQEGGHGAR